MKATTRLHVTNLAARLTTALALSCIAGGTLAHEADDDDAWDHDDDPALSARASCDTARVAAVFRNDRKVSVLLTKQFKQGEALALPGTPATPAPPVAAQDVCLVKLLVGPGSPGTAGAPSTSPGIGLEVWMPASVNWNERIHNLGGGGWAGGSHTSTTLIGNAQGGVVAGTGYVTGTTDTGHSIGNGSFALREDGTINTRLWHDFAERSLHQLALKAKRLARAFYGKHQKYAYWDGCSTGGRQGYKIAQEHPADYDGYLVGAPAFNWSRFITNELYPQIVMLRDLPAPLSTAKLNAVSAAATQACGQVNGQALGFILDPRQCHYDPTRDAAALCQGVLGNGGAVGTNTSTSCVTLAEARAINKIWYGQTVDGFVPDPAVDNSSHAQLQPQQLWWGLNRGANLTLLAGNASAPPFFGPFPIATDQVALELQDPTYATPTFLNASGNGANKWTQLSYGGLADAYFRGVALQDEFSHINTDNPDLRKAKHLGAKIISYHGWSDQLIPPLGSINYYTRVSSVTGGPDMTNEFNRLFMIPGMGHCAGVGSVGPNANANTIPLPAPNQFFNALVDWVEHRNAPEAVVLKSANASVSQPVCPYPKKAVYQGSGAITDAANYHCQ
jgi:Tannase and feruloyl esterase